MFKKIDFLAYLATAIHLIKTGVIAYAISLVSVFVALIFISLVLFELGIWLYEVVVMVRKRRQMADFIQQIQAKKLVAEASSTVFSDNQGDDPDGEAGGGATEGSDNGSIH